MKIKKLLLTDYRCFDSFEIDFATEYNVHIIIAENMVGKSALLAALRLAANTYTSGLQIEKQIQQNDHRVIGDNPIADRVSEVSIEVTAIHVKPDGQTEECVWKKFKTKQKGEKTKIIVIEGSDPRKISKSINSLTAEGKAVQPLFGFIGTEYIHVESSDNVEWEISGDSLDGYKNCFQDKSIKKFLFKWLAKMDNIMADIGRKKILAETYKDRPADAIAVFQQAVTSILGDIVAIEWDTVAKQPVVKLQNGDIRSFDMLSDGYRYLILLAGELATRSFILNKYLGKEVLKYVHGMVIIDEFGIHLHPSLQSKALERLHKTFPNVQFIVSTHSPLLLNGLKKEQVHILYKDTSGKRVSNHPEEDIIGMGANLILTKIFGLSTTLDNTFLKWEDDYRVLFRKKMENTLTVEESDQFAILSEHLTPLRLDPLLTLTKEDDTITSIVKNRLLEKSISSIGNFSLKTNDKNKTENENLEDKVNKILDELFLQ